MDPKENTYIQLKGELFEAVQKSQIFVDQKTFVDARPKQDPEKIIKLYKEQKTTQNFDLLAFVKEHFIIPTYEEPIPMAEISLQEYIHHCWTFLERNDPSPDKYSTRISIPHPYIVPGGRFRELYYWDSFFTALGMVKHHDFYMFMDMIKNYAYLIDNHGFIPNGTRIYYLSRSQPPVFVLYIMLLYKLKGIDAITPFVFKLEKEYEFWMKRMNDYAPDDEHTVKLKDNSVLNRYFDPTPFPREEAYAYDLELGKNLEPEKRKKLFQDLRAGAESGWDYSTRWFQNGRDLSTISTTDILPVDLNCLLYLVERKLSEWFKELEEIPKSNLYLQKANQRKKHINTLFWSPKKQFYFDYYWKTSEQSQSWTLASVYPLFVKIASYEQAHSVAEHIKNKFLKEGGLITTLTDSNEQWDKPNGWAPLQWTTVEALNNYGYTELAKEIKKRFTKTVNDSFKKTGSLFEKYNVESPHTYATGGEYINQIGFGWTNGVVLDFAN